MKTQLAVYAHCWVGNAPGPGVSGRCCEIIELVDESTMPHRFSFGRVLHKCANHADVPDEALYAVVQAEGAKVIQERRLHGQDIRTRFEGRGTKRKLKVF